MDFSADAMSARGVAVVLDMEFRQREYTGPGFGVGVHVPLGYAIQTTRG